MTAYLDPNHYQTAQIADELNAAATELRSLQIIGQLKPTLSKDGNQFCFLLGEAPNDCCVGFGDTVAKAMQDFCYNFFNYKAK